MEFLYARLWVITQLQLRVDAISFFILGGGLAFRDYASNFLATFSPMEIFNFASKNKQQNLQLLAIFRI